MRQSIQVAKKSYDLVTFTGTVAERNESIVSDVSSYEHRGQQNIRTTHTKITSFYLVNNNGEERAVTIKGTNVDMRAGHELTVFWCYKQNKNTGEVVAVYNKNLKDVFWRMESAFPFTSTFICIFSVLLILGLTIALFFLLGLPLLLLVWLFFTRSHQVKARKQFEKAIRDILDKM